MHNKSTMSAHEQRIAVYKKQSIIIIKLNLECTGKAEIKEADTPGNRQSKQSYVLTCSRLETEILLIAPGYYYS